MQTHERQLVLDQLASSEARLLELVDGLTPAQWAFRESPDRWSIAEVIEHVIAVEARIGRAIVKLLDTPPQPEKRAAAENKDPLVQKGAMNRSVKLNAPEAVRPTGKFADTNELVSELRRIRAQTTAFAAETQADLRNHFIQHMAFGDLDCYQWLIVLSRHGARHALQIEEIKAHPGWPN